jgi:hypothetical protein
VHNCWVLISVGTAYLVMSFLSIMDYPSVWWGTVLLLLGIVYCVRFAPGRQS